MSKIRVSIRCRPSDNIASELTLGDNNVTIDGANNKSDFVFDDVLDQTTTQETVFRKCVSGIIDQALDGFNGCVFAYGQTGAGKTHTMTGPVIQSFQERGVCLRAAGYLFEHARRRSIGDTNVVIRMSAIEIYNETLIDLFHKSSFNMDTDTRPQQPPKLVIVDLPGGVAIPALFLMPVDNEEDAYNLLLETFQNRMEAEHQLNQRSSRSHVIYTFYITTTKDTSHSSADDRRQMRRSSNGNNSQNGTDVIQSKLHLVDLAGSERITKTKSTGIVQKEASHINKSLTFLEQVVLALTQSKREHIPYRQSKLTYLLKDSIGGNCNTNLIACIWPNTDYLHETVSTLRFATRMKCIENHPVRNSLYQKETVLNSKLIQQIQMLKKELILKDMLLSLPYATPNANVPKLSIAAENGTESNRIGHDIRNCRSVGEQFGAELSKGQRIKTAKLAKSIAQCTNNVEDISHGKERGEMATGGCVHNSNGIDVEPFPSLELHSIAQTRWLIYLMHQIVWNACDMNADAVDRAIHTTFQKCGLVAHTHSNDGEASVSEQIPEDADEGVSDRQLQYEKSLQNNAMLHGAGSGSGLRKQNSSAKAKKSRIDSSDRDSNYKMQVTPNINSRDEITEESLALAKDLHSEYSEVDAGHARDVEKTKARKNRPTSKGIVFNDQNTTDNNVLPDILNSPNAGGAMGKLHPHTPTSEQKLPVIHNSPAVRTDSMLHQEDLEEHQQMHPVLKVEFDEYVSTYEEGRVLNAAYEASKLNLKQHKAKLKQLVSNLNKRKSKIDHINDELTHIDEELDSEEQSKSLQDMLKQTKQEYKELSAELTNVRSELSRLQAFKQEAMHDLINAYSIASGADAS